MIKYMVKYMVVPTILKLPNWNWNYMASSFIQCVTKKGLWSSVLLITLK